jgi:hypothetical protein
MSFTLTIRMMSAAFSGGDFEDHETAAETEVARILKLAAARVESGSWHGALKDHNGNTVGRFDLTDETRGEDL